MFKKIRKAALSAVSALSVCAIVGIAYAVWAFSDAYVWIGEEEAVSSVVEEATSYYGDLTITTAENPLTFVLDQYTDQTDSNKGAKSTDGDITGPYLTSATDSADYDETTYQVTTLSANWTLTSDDYTTLFGDNGTLKNATVTAYVNVYLSSALASYVKVSNEGVTTSNFATSSYNNEYTDDEGYTLYQFSTSNVSVDSTNYTYAISATPTFAYYTSSEVGSGSTNVAEPATFAEYQKMVAALCGETESDVQDGVVYELTANSIIIEYRVVAELSNS